MPIPPKVAADKLKGKLPAAKTAIDNVVKFANVPLKPGMAPGADAQAEEMLKKLRARAQGIMQQYKAYESSFLKLHAKSQK